VVGYDPRARTGLQCTRLPAITPRQPPGQPRALLSGERLEQKEFNGKPGKWGNHGAVVTPGCPVAPLAKVWAMAG